MTNEIKLNITEIEKNLPGSWKEITYKQAIELNSKFIPVETSDDTTTNMLIVVSELSGIPIDQVEKIPYMFITPLLNKISFVFDEYVTDKNSKPSFELQHPTEVKPKDFIYVMIQQDIQSNLLQILKRFSKVELTDEQIDKLSFADVQDGFFLFRKQLQKLVIGFRWKLRRNLLKQILMKLVLGRMLRMTRYKRNK